MKRFNVLCPRILFPSRYSGEHCCSIRSIQNSARQNIAEVGNAVKSIDEANELAGSSGAALGEIVSLAAANSSIVASIATAAEQQSATSEEINRSVDEVNHISAATSEAMRLSTSSVAELTRQGQVLRELIESMKSEGRG